LFTFPSMSVDTKWTKSSRSRDDCETGRGGERQTVIERQLVTAGVWTLRLKAIPRTLDSQPYSRVDFLPPRNLDNISSTRSAQPRIYVEWSRRVEPLQPQSFQLSGASWARQDGKRPGGLTLLPSEGDRGRGLGTWQSWLTYLAVQSPGSVAEFAASRKQAKYVDLQSVQFSVNCGWNCQSHKWLSLRLFRWFGLTDLARPNMLGVSVWGEARAQLPA